MADLDRDGWIMRKVSKVAFNPSLPAFPSHLSSKLPSLLASLMAAIADTWLLFSFSRAAPRTSPHVLGSF